jgi:hypothetical protein
MSNSVYVSIGKGCPGEVLVGALDQKPIDVPGITWERVESSSFARVKGELGNELLRVFGENGFGELVLDAAGVRAMTPFEY